MKKETELHTATKILAYLLYHPIKILEKYANRMSSIRISQCCNSHIAGLLFVIFSSAIRMFFHRLQNVPQGRYLKILYRCSAKTRKNGFVAVDKYIKQVNIRILLGLAYLTGTFQKECNRPKQHAPHEILSTSYGAYIHYHII